jgi:uncharacterized membrane protein
MYVYVTANKDAAAGERMFIAKVKSGEETLKEIGLKANVKEAAASNWSKLKTALEVAVAILVVLLVILGLVIGFSKLKGEKEEEAGEAGQTYY